MKKLINCTKVGDKLWHVTQGWCTRIEPLFDEGQLLVQFQDGCTMDYNAEGKERDTDINPSLFFHEIKLEQELPEFIEGEIVLVEEYLPDKRNTVTLVAKYIQQEEGYSLIAIVGDSETTCVENKYIKSFDVSHFK
jgi:hypothetical protein